MEVVLICFSCVEFVEVCHKFVSYCAGDQVRMRIAYRLRVRAKKWVDLIASYSQIHPLFVSFAATRKKMALSSLVQTRSMELVLAPIASHVSCSQTESPEY